MKQRILNETETFDFYNKSKSFKFIEDTKTEFNFESKFGVDVVNTGKNNLLFYREFSEKELGISDDSFTKHLISLRLIREETIDGINYVVFSTLGLINDQSFAFEFFIVKDPLIYCLNQYASTNPSKMVALKLMNVNGLDMTEYFE